MKFKAIIIGVVVDIIGTALFAFVGTFVLMTFVVLRLTSQGIPPDQVGSHINAAAAEHQFAYALAATAFGLLFVALGGYVAGRLANEKEVLNGTLVALIGTLFMIVTSQFMSGQPFPLWLTIVGYVGALPSGTLGGFFARRHRERRNIVGSDSDPLR